MARYSSFKYSDEKYGASTVTEAGSVTWIVNVDWDDDKVFDGTSEGDKLLKISLKRGRERYLASSGDGFEKMRPGKATLILDNKDRRYDPRNASSPLYPNVSPGKQVYIRVRDNANDETYTIFRGLIDDIIPIMEPGGGKVQIECKDFLQVLNDTKLSTLSGRINTNITGALRALLYDASFPSPLWLDEDTQPVIAFGVVDANAGQMACDLAEAALGTFFINKIGRACFYSRNHSDFVTHTIGQAEIGSEIQLSQPWDGVFNSVKVIAHNQIKKLPSVIYFLSNPIAVTSGNSYTIYPKYNAAMDVQISKLEGNTAKDGTGTAITVSISAATLGQAGGSVTVLASGNGYITKLEIRGRQYAESPEEFSENVAADMLKHGLKQFTLDNQFLQDRNYASEFVGILGTDNDFLYTARNALAIRIFSRPDIQYKFDLLDKVALTVAALDISDTFYVLGIEHKNRGANMQDIETTIYLDKILQDSTSITPAEVDEEQQDAPPGYEDPGGDPGGTDEGESTSGALTSHYCCHGLSTGIKYPLTSYSSYETVIIKGAPINPDSMIVDNDPYIHIKDDGYYSININGFLTFYFVNQAFENVEENTVGAYPTIYLNDIAYTSSPTALPYGLSRVGSKGGNFGAAVPITGNIIYPLSLNDTIRFELKYEAVYTLEAFTRIQWNVCINVFKVRNS